MDEGLKQRLVGAAVLVLLAVIFVPMLLESGREPGGIESAPQTPSSSQSAFSSRVIPIDEPAEATPESIAPPSSPESGPVGEETRELATSRTAEIPLAPEASQAPEVPQAPEVLSSGGESQVAAIVPEPVTAPGPEPEERAEAEPEERTDAEPEVPAAVEPPEGSREEGSPPAESASEEPPASVGWAAQFGSFAERRNALVLRNRLRAQGYPAFTESASSGQAEVTRVLVGPEPTRDRTVAVIEALRRDTGLDGFVVRHPRD